MIRQFRSITRRLFLGALTAAPAALSAAAPPATAAPGPGRGAGRLDARDLDGVAYGGRADCSAALSGAAAGTTLVISGLCRIARSVAIGCDLEFTGSGALAVDGGHTVTLAGSVAAPAAPIFAGTGAVAFAAGMRHAHPGLPVQWWGAVGDGAAIDTPALQKACHAAATGTGHAVYLCAGTYVIDATLEIDGAKVSLLGEPGGDLSTYRPVTIRATHTATGGVAIWVRRDSAYCRIQNIHLVGAAATGGTGIACGDIAGSGWTANGAGCLCTTVQNCTIQSFGLGLDWLQCYLPTCRDSEFYQCGVGIRPRVNCNDGRILNNHFHTIAGRSIHFDRGGDGPNLVNGNFQVTGNMFEATGSPAIDIPCLVTSWISDNLIGTGGIRIDPSADGHAGSDDEVAGLSLIANKLSVGDIVVNYQSILFLQGQKPLSLVGNSAARLVLRRICGLYAPDLGAQFQAIDTDAVQGGVWAAGGSHVFSDLPATRPRNLLANPNFQASTAAVPGWTAGSDPGVSCSASLNPAAGEPLTTLFHNTHAYTQSGFGGRAGHGWLEQKVAVPADATLTFIAYLEEMGGSAQDEIQVVDGAGAVLSTSRLLSAGAAARRGAAYCYVRTGGHTTVRVRLKFHSSSRPLHYRAAALYHGFHLPGTVGFSVDGHGTFTPGIAGSSSPGRATYVARQGHWSRQGDQITVRGHVEFSSLAGAAGDTWITGLPVPATPGAGGFSPIEVVASGVTLPAGAGAVCGLVRPGETSIGLGVQGNGVALRGFLSTSGAFHFGGTYLCAP